LTVFCVLRGTNYGSFLSREVFADTAARFCFLKAAKMLPEKGSSPSKAFFVEK